MTIKRRGLAWQLLITLDGIEPPIWRRVIVVPGTTLHELHRIIQVLFNWYDYHLYQFDVDGRRFEAPWEEAEGEDSTKAKLSTLIERPGQVFRYTYDFGDGWDHRVDVEEHVAAPSTGWLPWLVDGSRSGPPEDAGGVPGYERLVQALAMPPDERDDEDQPYREWVGPEYDPERFDVLQARHALLLCSAWGALRRRR